MTKKGDIMSCQSEKPRIATMRRGTCRPIPAAVLVSAFLLLNSAFSAWAQVPGMVSFQGVLKDSLGQPLSGAVMLEFRIFDAASGGNLVDMDGDGAIENVVGQDVREILATAVLGVVSTQFGPVSPTVFSGQPRFVEVTVISPAPATALTRVPMTTSPAVAEQLYARGTTNVAVSTDSAGNVGLGGTTAPETRLHILSGSDVTGAGGGYIQMGPTAAENMGLDNNEIMARNNGVPWTLVLNVDGGDVDMCANGGNVGIGTNLPEAKLHVSGNGGDLSLEGSNHFYISYYPDGISAGRKAYMGFAGPTDDSFTIANEVSGAHIMLRPAFGGSVGIGNTTPDGHMLDVASTSGDDNNSAIRARYPGGGQLLNAEFAALAHRDADWTALYAKQGAARSAAYFVGLVGIGTPTPAAQLDVRSSASDPGTAVYGESESSTNGIGVYGYSRAATGGASGVVGASNSGSGVEGFAYSDSGLTFGGRFVNVSTRGTGVYGLAAADTPDITYGGRFEATGTAGRGVYGVAGAPSGTTYGGYFENHSLSGTAVYGEAVQSGPLSYGGYFTGGTGAYGRGLDGDGGRFESSSRGVYGIASNPSGGSYGVQGESASTSGRGVYGLNTAAIGAAYGVYGETGSTSGRAVYGKATSTSGSTFAGYFETASSIGTGVWAVATATSGTTFGVFGGSATPDGRGVFGWATDASGNNFGVYGATNSNTNGFGVFSFGRTGATGTKSFRIDHPLDPANKYLLHYSVEGPEPQNVYNGTVRTDAAGFAWVELPAYFAEINRDCRYQLTVIDEGDEFVMAKISREIETCRFQIRTSRPNVKVCWEVKGVRNDAFVRAYGAPVEVDKSENERGKYQHPELYGRPPEDGINQRPGEGSHLSDQSRIGEWQP